ncbi:MAG: ArsI/CadI family heavy metal resistance metalloenzyme [Acidimicrobiales bacterium]
MSRAQLALNVVNLDDAVAFYTKLFGAAPAKLRPGYANFAIADPPLKLVLIENHDPAVGPLNHLGVELSATEQVSAAQDRLVAEGLSVEAKDRATCCYALQDKIWAHGPGGQSWELYTVLADSETPDGQTGPTAGTEPTCCGAALPAAASGSCC